MTYPLPVDERTNDLPVACPRLCMVMICARRETSENGTAERESGKDKVEINSWTVLVTATATGQFHLHRLFHRCLPRCLPALLDSCAGCGGSEECPKYGGTTSSKQRVFLPRLRHSFCQNIHSIHKSAFLFDLEWHLNHRLVRHCVYLTLWSLIIVIGHCDHWSLLLDIVITDHCYWTLLYLTIGIKHCNH